MIPANAFSSVLRHDTSGQSLLCTPLNGRHGDCNQLQIVKLPSTVVAVHVFLHAECTGHLSKRETLHVERGKTKPRLDVGPSAPPRRGSSPPLSPCEGSLPDPPSAEGTEAQASALLGRLRLLRGETGFDGVFGPQNATSSPENAICLWTPAPRFLWIVRPNPELVCSRKNPNVARKNSNDS